MSSNKLSDYFPKCVIEEIAMRAYHIIRAYCVNPSVGIEDKFITWHDAEQWHRDSVISGVKYHIDNFNVGGMQGSMTTPKQTSRNVSGA